MDTPSLTPEPEHTPARHHVLTNDEGASTAEYAVVILAAVALAGALVTIVRSSEVQAMLLDLVQRAFAAAG